jgi:hypothetical protein
MCGVVTLMRMHALRYGILKLKLFSFAGSCGNHKSKGQGTLSPHTIQPYPARFQSVVPVQQCTTPKFASALPHRAALQSQRSKQNEGTCTVQVVALVYALIDGLNMLMLMGQCPHCCQRVCLRAQAGHQCKSKSRYNLLVMLKFH